MAVSTPTLSVGTICGPKIALLALVTLAHGAAVGAQENSPSKAEESKLPGRIFITVSQRGNVMRGLLAVDPNDRTCATIDEKAGQFARVAPGGRRFVYQAVEAGNGPAKLQAVDLDQDADPVRVFDRSGYCSWAGDGKELLLSQLFAGGGPDEPRSFRIKADGSAHAKLSIPATELVWDWSPDGQWVLTSSARRKGDSPPSPQYRYDPLYVMRLEGSNAAEVAPAGADLNADGERTMNAPNGSPHFSPDGREVVYVRFTSLVDDSRAIKKVESKVWVVGRDGRHRRVVYEGNNEDGYPVGATWSPDGKAFALTLRKQIGEKVPDVGRPALAIINADGTNLREIPLPPFTGLQLIDWR